MYNSGGLIALFAICLPLFFYSCTDKIDEMRSVPNIVDLPSMTAENMDMYHSQYGKVNLHVVAKTVNLFSMIEQPKTEFPNGILVEFFDENMKITSYLSANEAVYYEKELRWEASGNVEAKNAEGTIFNTEFLEWDENSEEIKSDKSIRVTDNDGIIVGRGFRAKQDFTDWKIYKTTGVFNVNQKDFAPIQTDSEDTPF
ncbi:MAG: LPS export ABC transporter periplasmic protein LptC [Salinivirgaceae bacterium]|nr:LPS export ABC transporter periplasmic protein LptC [Salinivirgaceae bacterium]